MRRLYDETDARRLLNPGPVAIVTTRSRGMANAATIAWTVVLSMDPPLIGCAIHPQRHTADMIRTGEEFALNIPGPALLKQTAFLGTRTGAEANKIEEAALETFDAVRIDVPLVEGCLAWIECGLQDVLPVGDHTLYIGKVVAVHADDEAYAERWLLEDPAKSPLVFLGGTHYGVLGDPLEAVVEIDEMGVLIVETPEEREKREEEEGRQRELAKREGDEGAEELRAREDGGQ